MMIKSSEVATILVLPLALWSAHLAGAAYILARNDPRAHRYAVAKSVFSVLLAALVVYINW